MDEESSAQLNEYSDDEELSSSGQSVNNSDKNILKIDFVAATSVTNIGLAAMYAAIGKGSDSLQDFFLVWGSYSISALAITALMAYLTYRTIHLPDDN